MRVDGVGVVTIEFEIKVSLPGDTIDVYWTFLLAGPKGKGPPRKRMLANFKAFEAKGAVIHETATGRRSDDKDERDEMLEEARDMLAASGRSVRSAENGKKSHGRPPRVWGVEAEAAMRLIWRDHKTYKTDAAAWAALDALGLKGADGTKLRSMQQVRRAIGSSGRSAIVRRPAPKRRKARKR